MLVDGLESVAGSRTPLVNEVESYEQTILVCIHF